MILLADSGATKTEWVHISEEGVRHLERTSGINPWQLNKDQIVNLLEQELAPGDLDVTKVRFYGAGCGSGINRETVRDALSIFFPDAAIEVDHDLLAAAHALCNDEPGIACILGTGMGSCLYDGNRIIDSLSGLGYALADEGSGAYLGKKLLNAALRRELPADLNDMFFSEYPVTSDEVLMNVYHKPMPSGYLATFSHFLSANREHPWVHELIIGSFRTFFRKNVIKFEGYSATPVHFVGSVAFYYQEVLREAAEQEGIRLGRIEENPISGLITYHQKKLD